jgi:CheY-like chemotaxis protein
MGVFMTGRKKKRILLVEDNPGDARLIREMLKESGSTEFELTHVATLAEGLNAVAHSKFDVILLDLLLADSTGMETFQRLKDIGHDDAAVIVLTGIQDKEMGVRAVRSGAQDYVPKNALNSELLVRSILHAVERQQAIVEKEALVAGLKDALAKVRKLSGLLPICASCKKIRDDKGYWRQVEVYIKDHTDAEFTHGYCPECAAKLWKE